MPMSFPDMQSLKNRATLRNFRQPQEGESERDYRAAFALFMRDVDLVESLEIADGRGWDQQGPFGLMAGLMEAKPGIRALVEELREEYPHVTVSDGKELELKFFGQEATNLQAAFEQATALTNIQTVDEESSSEEHKVTHTLTQTQSRGLVARLLHASIIETNKESALQSVANQLGSEILLRDMNIRWSITKQKVGEEGFALRA